MAKKKAMPRLRVKARIATKVMERDLKSKAKMLIDDPELIFPECAEDCGSCNFKKTRARIERILKYKDDPAKLARFARHGDKLARAYAATIGLVHEEKTPYLASSTYPEGTITYALRGKTPKEKLIGVQNFDSPRWRVLSVLDLVHKKGQHFYSFGDEFVCTGRYSRPPQGYVKFAAESVGATKLEGDAYLCPHNPRSENHIEFNWTSAGKKVLLCDQCNGRLKNTLSKLAEGMAVPNVLSEFEISIVRPLKPVGDAKSCDDLLRGPIDKELLEKYAAGQLGNRDLVEQHMKAVLESAKKTSRRAFVKGDRCFGDDMDAFIGEIASDEVERKALRGLLEKVESPVILESGASVNDLLSEFWSEHGKDALSALVSEEKVERLYKDDDESSKSPLRIIRQAVKEAEHEAVSSNIPSYTCLSQYGELADSATRAYKTGGNSTAVAVLDADKSNDHRTRSIAYGFYLALGVTSKSWKYTDEEREYGKHLQEFAKKLLESESADEHHKAFENLLREAGCSDEIKRA